MESKPANPPRRTSNVWWIITAASVFGIFAPELLGIKGFDGGFAISGVCILLAITGIIIALVYTARAGKLDRILKGDNLFTHWTYSRDEWQQYAEEEHRRQKSGNRKTFIMIAVIALVVGLGFWLMNRGSGPVVLLAILGTIALIALVAWATTAYNYRQNKTTQGQAYFTPDAVYLNRQLHDFNSLGSKLEHVELKGEQQQYIGFTYSFPTRNGRDSYELRVPVPQGKDEEARKLVEKYNSSL
jgi:hypothetical protein